MNRFLAKLAVCVFVLVVLVGVYIGLVQIIDVFRPTGILKAFGLRSSRSLVDSTEFAMGDRIKIVAESSVASVYYVRVYQNSSVVFEGKGAFSGSTAEEDVCLCSSTFAVGTYSARLDAYVYNFPLPGAEFSDSGSWVFQVVGAETRLAVNATFDSCYRGLEASANLTDSYDSPVAGEAVEFDVKLASRTKMTDGWIPLGRAETGASGTAKLRVAFSMPSGNYSIMAKHVGNANFGESSAVAGLEVITNQSFGNSYASMPGLSVFSVGLVSGVDSADWSVLANSYTPYADLANNLTAQYSADFSLEGYCCAMMFFLDYMNRSGYLGPVAVEPSLENSRYVYRANLTWTLAKIGLHKLIIGIVNGSIDDMNLAQNGQGMFSSVEETFDVQRCPSAMIVQHPGAVSGDTLPVTAGFFRPRPYQIGGSGFCVATTLAPTLAYNGVSYSVDDPVKSVTVGFYVNGSLKGPWFTQADGLLTFPVGLNSSETHFTLNVTAVADESDMLYEGKTESVTLNFTTVSVHNVSAGGSDASNLNCTVYNCNGKTDNIYVGPDNTLRAEASLFGMPLQDANVSFSVEESIARSETASGSVQVPSSSDLLGVVNVRQTVLPFQRLWIRFDNGTKVYLDSHGCAEIPANVSSVTVFVEPPTGDINFDGVVNILDAIMFANSFGSSPGKPSWNSYADLNDDGTLNILDAIALANNYLKTNESATVDGTVEFFKASSPSTFEGQAVTSNLGIAEANWVPSEAATYLVRAMMPSDFTATVDFTTQVTQVNALYALSCVTVERRTVSLAIVSPADANSATALTDADSYVEQAQPNGNYGSATELLVGSETSGSPIHLLQTLVRFDLSTIPTNAYIVSARLNLFGSCDVNEGQVYCSVYRVLYQWYENDVNWGNRPNHSSTASCVLYFSQSWTDRWLFFDVTEDVRLWKNGSETNYGFLLMGSDFSMTLNSREASSNNPALEVSYITASPDLVAGAYDNVTMGPIRSLHVTFNVDGRSSFERDTNSSGLACIADWYADSPGAHTVTVSSVESTTFEAGFTSRLVDLRFPTNITVEFQNPKGVSVGFAYTYSFSLASSSLFALEDMPVKLYITGTFANGTYQAEAPLENTTVSNGTVSFRWAASEAGTYFLNATFDGSVTNMPAQAFATVSASVTPLAVLFDVSTHEFGPGTSLVLNATVIDISANRPMSDPSVTVEFLRSCSDGSTTPLGNALTSNGTATLRTDYPNDSNGGKAYAYMAKVVPAAGSLCQGIACNPLQLTVSKSSRLSLNVARDWLSGNHTIQGFLSSAVFDAKQVKITVNGTDYTTTTFWGFFGLSLSLQPVNNSATTYTITASCDDTSPPVTATAWTTTLDGQQYPACTTVQYDYEPAYNTTTLTVLPQSTEVLSMTTSPEEMQKQAQNSGWLTLYNEWSWWYPWYKLHLKIHVNPTIDIGFSPVLPGGETYSWDGLAFFVGLTGEVISDVILDFAGLFTAFFIARHASMVPIVGAGVGLAIELGKIAVQSTLLYFTDWQNRGSGLLGVAIGNVLMGILALKASIAEAFIRDLMRLCKWVASALMNIFDALARILEAEQWASRWWIDGIEAGADFALAALGMARYAGYL